MANKIHSKRISSRESLNIQQAAALRDLREKLVSYNTELQKEFAQLDPSDTGQIPIHKWSQCVERVTGFNVPWRSLADRLVTLSADNKHVLYKSVPKVQLGKEDMNGKKQASLRLVAPLKRLAMRRATISPQEHAGDALQIHGQRQFRTCFNEGVPRSLSSQQNLTNRHRYK